MIYVAETTRTYLTKFGTMTVPIVAGLVRWRWVSETHKYFESNIVLHIPEAPKEYSGVYALARDRKSGKILTKPVFNSDSSVTSEGITYAQGKDFLFEPTTVGTANAVEILKSNPVVAGDDIWVDGVPEELDTTTSTFTLEAINRIAVEKGIDAVKAKAFLDSLWHESIRSVVNG